MHGFKLFYLLKALLFGFLIQAAEPSGAPVDPLARVTEKAWRIHRGAIVIDGHNDLPEEMRAKAHLSFDEIDISKSVTNLNTDIPRLRRGGMGAQFWAAFVPTTT